MKKITVEEMKALVGENSFGRNLPEEFVLKGNDAEVTIRRYGSDEREWDIETVDGNFHLENGSSLLSFVHEDKEAIFKIIKILERVKDVGDLESENPFMQRSALIKIFQMSELTSLKQVLDDLTDFSDEELLDAFFVRGQWAAYREWLKMNK